MMPDIAENFDRNKRRQMTEEDMKLLDEIIATVTNTDAFMKAVQKTREEEARRTAHYKY